MQNNIETRGNLCTELGLPVVHQRVKCTQSRNFQFDINPVHFKILSTRKVKHGNVCKSVLKTPFQKYKLELTIRI